MKYFSFLLGFICLLTINAKAQVNKPSSKPNIIFILADDLGYGDLGCYGQQKVKTPNIDALAKTGMKFTQFYSGSTVCAPSRASLMTGLHTGHTPVRGNRPFQPEGQAPLPDSAITIAMELQKAGYSTAAFGKWGLGYVTTSGSPSKKGFAKFYGYNCQTQAHNFYPDHLWDNEQRVELPENLVAPTVYSGDRIQGEALKFINEQQKDKPFFLFLPYTLPHADLTVPHDSVYDHYVKLFGEEPLKETDKRNANKQFVELYPHAAFAAMVTRLDKYVGEVIAAVNKKGIAGNTIIIFTSDNGPHQEKGGDPDFFDSNGKYKGIKRDLYEGGIRVPMIVSWKGKVKAGTQSNHVGAFWDLFPSFQQIAGLPVSKNIDGISIFPLIMNRPQPAHEYLYWEFHEGGGKQAVRWKNWKAIKLNASSGKDEPIELYDLGKDPSEKNNVAVQNKKIVEKMEAFMKSAHQRNIDWPLFPQEK
ncbi:MAG TPA: arylsulfatase [Chitinophagaceae bacterium]